MEEIKQETLPIPCTPIFDTLSRTVELGNNQAGRVAEFLEEYATKHPHTATAKPRELTLEIRPMKSGNIEYHFIAEGQAIGVRFNGIEKLDGDSGAAAKVLQLIFAKIIQSCHNLRTKLTSTPDGKQCTAAPPENPQILLTPLELYNLGIFQSEDSARAHMKEILFKLNTIMLRISNKEIEDYQVLFTGISVDKPHQHWVITLNPKILFWTWLIHYYCRFPIAGFKLSNKGFALLRYLMILTNLNRGKISKQGYFVLTIDSLIERLRLNKNDKHKDRAVVQPITKIINEINATTDLGVRLELDVAGATVRSFTEGKVRVYVQPDLLRKWAMPKSSIKALPNKGGKV